MDYGAPYYFLRKNPGKGMEWEVRTANTSTKFAASTSYGASTYYETFEDLPEHIRGKAAILMMAEPLIHIPGVGQSGKRILRVYMDEDDPNAK